MEVDDSKVNTPDEVLQDENETPIDNENEEDYDEGDMLHEDGTLVRNTLDNYKTWKENVPYLYDIQRGRKRTYCSAQRCTCTGSLLCCEIWGLPLGRDPNRCTERRWENNGES